MKKYLIILFLGCFSIAVSQKKENDIESFTEQAKDDAKALTEKKYDYLDKFHKAIREKISNNNTEAMKIFKECLVIRPADDAANYALAEIAREEKNTSLSLKYYQKAYQIDPNNITYLKRLAEMHYSMGSFKKAAPLFKKLCESDPRNPDYRFAYSKVLIYTKSYPKAIKELDDLQEQIGVMPQLKLMEVDLYTEVKEYSKAEEVLMQLKDMFPADNNVLKAIVRFYNKRGNKEKASDALKELLKIDPNNGMAQFILAKNYLANDNIKQFVELAPRILQNSNVIVKNKLIILKALKQIKGDKDQTVQRSVQMLYKNYPENATIALNYGRFLIANHHSKEALKVFRKALILHKNDFNLWSQVLLFEEDYMEWQALYKDGNTALGLFPSMPFIYYQVAKGALYTGHPEEAKQILAGGEIYLIDDDSNQAAKFSMRKGEIYFYEKHYKKGIIAFEKALSLSDAPEIKISYALALAKVNIATDVALDLLDKVKKEQRNSHFYRASALILLNQNKFNEGINLLEIGINNVFNNAELYDLLGDFYCKNKQLNKALEAWEIAKKLGSRNKELPNKIQNKQYYAPIYL